MADLGLKGNLSTGVITQLVAAETTTGTTHSYQFGVQAAPDGLARTLAVGCVGASATPTTVTGDLEVSYDGGTTFQKYKTGIAFVATTVATSLITSIVAGPIYRINNTTVTIGSAVTFQMFGCLS